MFDSYLKGHHKICQDYIYTTENCAILADGCSSAKHTDIGARLLAHSYNNVRDMKYGIVDANFIRKDLALSQECLFSTLGEIRKEKDILTVNLWGDGVLVVKSKLDFQIWKISYDKAPYYPVYDYIYNGRESYIREFGQPIVKWDVSYPEYDQSPIESEITEPFQKSLSVSVPIDNVEYVLLFSDGICAFPENYKEIINELCEFKSFQGEFLNRRLSSLFKRQWKDHFVNDDMSVVGYYNDTQEGKE